MIGLGLAYYRSQQLLRDALFRGGEQGAWYDPSDLSTMFQNSAGTTPVTAVEQPVGLVLDKRKGMALGAETITNEDFAGGATGWTVGTNWAISGATAVATAAVYNTNNLDQSISLVAGRTYKLAFSVPSYASGSIRADIVGAISVITGGISSAGTYQTLFVSTVTNPMATLRITGSTGGGFTGSIDNISVREVLGNHASQPTSAARPVLSARVNLLTKTEDFGDAVWATSSNVTIATNQTTAPDGTNTADSMTEVATTATHRVTYNIPDNLTITHTASLYMKAKSGSPWGFLVVTNGSGTNQIRAWYNLANGTVGTVENVGASTGASASMVSVGDGWYRCTVSGIPNGSGGTPIAFFGMASGNGALSYLGNVGRAVYIWGASLVYTDQASLPYQRVNTATDYDTVGFPKYLKFDGVDDFLVTNSIDFSATDEMTVWSGVRKLSDASRGIIAELSSNPAGNNGIFIFGQGSTSPVYWNFNSKGTTYGDTLSLSAYTAPITNILTGTSDISADSTKLRVNGSQVAQSTADQGTGNYGNYPLYIGMRAGTSLPFRGHLYGLIVRGKTTDTALLARVEGLMNSLTKAY